MELWNLLRIQEQGAQIPLLVFSDTSTPLEPAEQLWGLWDLLPGGWDEGQPPSNLCWHLLCATPGLLHCWDSVSPSILFAHRWQNRLC